MNINPIITLIAQTINIYNFFLLVYIVMHWLFHFDIINRKNELVNKFFFTLHQFMEPLLSRIRRHLPRVGGVDISPIVAFLLLNFTKNVLFTYFYKR